MTLHPCHIDDDHEDLNISKIVAICHQCAMDVCIARIEARIERMELKFMNERTWRRLEAENGEPR